MKCEQIANQETLMSEYSYTYFQKIVRFKLKNKNKNKNNFLPLSEAEIQDLNFDKTKMIDNAH